MTISKGVHTVLMLYLSVSTLAPPFKLVDVPGKGRGLLATNAIARGERILAEAPLLRYSETISPSQLASAISKLSSPDQAAFAALHNAHPHLPQAIGIIRTNGLEVNDTEGGVFTFGSRFNHSCAPNVSHHWDERRQVQVFQANRAITPNEELTIYYVRLLDSSETRKTKLRTRFDFECACEVCAGVDVAASDQRRQLVQSTTDQLPSLGSSPLRLVIKVREALKALDHERLAFGRGQLIFDVWQVSVMYGDKASADKWAKLLMELRRVTDGIDSEDYAEAKALVGSAARHPMFAAMGRKVVGGPE
ncbi:hypothetical protein RQP46_003272 [Phenoliferia psychrophenolica]